MATDTPNPDWTRQSFEEQIKFFIQKLNVPTHRWDDIWAEAHDVSFMVAGAAQADLLADLREAVETAITDGQSIEQFRQNFDGVVQKYGWDYTGERNWRTRLIYGTNMTTSYAAGRYAQLTDPELLKLRPYWMYKHAEHVLQPRPMHVYWSGTTLPADDPWWDTHFPPNGFNCHCYVVAVSEEQGRAQGGKFRTPEGDSGVDPGFGYAPGKSRVEEAQRLLAEKEARLNGNA